MPATSVAPTAIAVFGCDFTASVAVAMPAFAASVASSIQSPFAAGAGAASSSCLTLAWGMAEFGIDDISYSSHRDDAR